MSNSSLYTSTTSTFQTFTVQSPISSAYLNNVNTCIVGLDSNKHNRGTVGSPSSEDHYGAFTVSVAPTSPNDVLRKVDVTSVTLASFATFATANSVISGTDTIHSALAKAQGQINSAMSGAVTFGVTTGTSPTASASASGNLKDGLTLSLVLPPMGSGASGTSATIAVYPTVGKLGSTATPTVTNRGTSSAAVLEFGIPCGVDGAQGPVGPPGTGFTVDGQGSVANRDIVKNSSAKSPYFYVATDNLLYIYTTSAGWSTGIPFVGAKGDTGLTGGKGDTGSTGGKGDKGDTGSTGGIGGIGPAGPQRIVKAIQLPWEDATSSIVYKLSIENGILTQRVGS